MPAQDRVNITCPCPAAQSCNGLPEQSITLRATPGINRMQMLFWFKLK